MKKVLLTFLILVSGISMSLKNAWALPDCFPSITVDEIIATFPKNAKEIGRLVSTEDIKKIKIWLEQFGPQPDFDVLFLFVDDAHPRAVRILAGAYQSTSKVGKLCVVGKKLGVIFFEDLTKVLKRNLKQVNY